MKRLLLLAVTLIILPLEARAQIIDAIVNSTGRHRWQSTPRRTKAATRPQPDYDWKQDDPGEPYASDERPRGVDIAATVTAGLGPWEEAEALSRLYVEQLHAMNQKSKSLYSLLEQVQAERDSMQRSGREGVTIANSIAQTEAVLQRTKSVLAAYGELRQSAYVASNIQPSLIKVLDRLAQQDLKGAVGSSQFKAQQQMLHVKGDQLARQVEHLKAQPVTLPDNFDEMGRYLWESNVVLEKSVRVDRIRGRLSDDDDVSGLAIAVGFDKYLDYYADWRGVQLTQWREGNLKELFRSANLDTGTVTGSWPAAAVPVSYAQPTDSHGRTATEEHESGLDSLSGLAAAIFWWGLRIVGGIVVLLVALFILGILFCQ